MCMGQTSPPDGPTIRDATDSQLETFACSALRSAGLSIMAGDARVVRRLPGRAYVEVPVHSGTVRFRGLMGFSTESGLEVQDAKADLGELSVEVRIETGGRP